MKVRHALSKSCRHLLFPRRQKCSKPWSKTTSQGSNWMSRNWSLRRCCPPGSYADLGHVCIFPMLVDVVLCPIYFVCMSKSEKVSLFILMLNNLSCNLLFWNWEFFKIMCILSEINVCTAIFQCHLTLLLCLMPAQVCFSRFQIRFLQCNLLSIAYGKYPKTSVDVQYDGPVSSNV